MRGLGADRVIDYTKEDFTQGPERYDLMVSIAGSRSWSECVRLLEPKATLVAVGTSSAHSLGGILGHAAHMRLRSIGASQRLVIFLARIRQADLLVLRQLLQSGKVTPVIDRRYPLSQGAEDWLTSGPARARQDRSQPLIALWSGGSASWAGIARRMRGAGGAMT